MYSNIFQNIQYSYHSYGGYSHLCTFLQTIVAVAVTDYSEYIQSVGPMHTNSPAHSSSRSAVSLLQHQWVLQATPRNLENPQGYTHSGRKEGEMVLESPSNDAQLPSNGSAGKVTKVPGVKTMRHHHRVSVRSDSLLVHPDLPPYGLAHPQGHRENGSCLKWH